MDEGNYSVAPELLNWALKFLPVPDASFQWKDADVDVAMLQREKVELNALVTQMQRGAD